MVMSNFHLFSIRWKKCNEMEKMGHVVIAGLVCTLCNPSFVVTIRNLYSIKKNNDDDLSIHKSLRFAHLHARQNV